MDFCFSLIAIPVTLHPPEMRNIRDGTDHQRCLQNASTHFKNPRFKTGGVLKGRQKDRKGGIITPVPPNGSQVQCHPSQPTQLRVGNDHKQPPPQNADLYMNETRSQPGCMFKCHQTDTIRHSDLGPWENCMTGYRWWLDLNFCPPQLN